MQIDTYLVHLLVLSLKFHVVMLLSLQRVVIAYVTIGLNKWCVQLTIVVLFLSGSILVW